MLLVCQVLQVLAIAVLFLEIIYISFQRSSDLQIILLLLTLSTLITMLGYLIEISSDNLQSAYIGTVVGYIGKPFTLLTSFLLTVRYCGWKLRKRWVIPLAFYCAAFSILVCTNEYHYLYYSSVVFDRSLTISPLILGHGPAYYLYMATTIVFMLLDLIVAVREYRRAVTKEGRHQILYLFGIVAAAMGGYLIFLTGVTGGYDSTMAGCFAGTLILVVLFLRYRLFDFLSLAKEQSLDSSTTGLLVLDMRGEVAYVNATMKHLLSDQMTAEALLNLDSSQTTLELGQRVYALERKTVVDGGRTFGTTVELSDITDSYRYSTRLKQEVEDRTREVRHIQRTIIGSFANIVEARDDSTGTHIKATSAYVQIIAKSLQKLGIWPEIMTDTNIIRFAEVAPLHDIGKLSIPDSILLKPGKLTAEEFDIIKTHTIRGKEIIEQTMRGVERDEYVTLAENIAYCHHEKWDGSGYPQGLSGEAIPRSARIMAVADVYDAIRSKRCYKDAMSKTEARKIIQEGRGTHFDPQVVDAFLAAIEEIEAV